MTKKELKQLIVECINESASLNRRVIVIDVQPAYHSHCKVILPKLIKFLNSRTGEIVLFFNGQDIGEDSKDQVLNYFLENGLDEDKVDLIKFREKTYAFFRNWMDAGMDRHFIIRAIRYMVMNKRYDSTDVTNEEWAKVFPDDWNEFTDLPEIIENDSIQIPDISISELKSWNGSLLCGGSKDECFAELTLLFNAFNIKYTEIKSLIY